MLVATIQVFVGFSILAAPILLIGYLFFLRDMGKSGVGRIACIALLGFMSSIQIYHWLFLQGAVEPFASRVYCLLLLATPASFFFFSREILVPGATRSPLHVLHLAPFLAGPFLPLAWIPTIAFVIGAGYSVWFAMFVFGLRRHVRRYPFELFFFCYFAVLAIVMLVLATSAGTLGNDVFYMSYALFTGATFVLVIAAMIWFPHSLVDMSDIARLAYAKSTLTGVDVDDKLKALEHAMTTAQLYQNEDLNLGMLADAVGLTSHQLSELINTRFGVGFSRYVREIRVTAAKKLLRDDHVASVLSIGLATGFRSQSTFYAAFRDVAGESPGAYRERHQNG